MMEGRLRTMEQGADTVVWLALSRAASRTRNGQFFQGIMTMISTRFHKDLFYFLSTLSCRP